MTLTRWLQLSPGILIVALMAFLNFRGDRLVRSIYLRWHFRRQPSAPVRPVYVRKPRVDAMRRKTRG